MEAISPIDSKNNYGTVSRRSLDILVRIVL
jgi:hypothetical protein